MSVAYKSLEMPIEREFKLPFVKRIYATTSTLLSKNGFAASLAEMMDEGMLRGDVEVGGQVQLHGGKYSNFRNGGKQGRAHFVQLARLHHALWHHGVLQGERKGQEVGSRIQNAP
jgi:hypothetical protein